MPTIKLLSFSMIAAVLLSSFAQSASGVPQDFKITLPPVAKATFAKESHDFGEIPKGVPVSVEFSFTNTGDEALIIKDVVTSCGCTASDYAREPILPGKSSKIKVTYNAANPGAFTKTITVNSNGQEAVKVLNIKGVVK